MKKVKKNMFQNTIVSLVIVVIVLFLSVPVNAQYSNSTQINPMMQMCYTQLNPFVYGATQTNPAHGPSSPNTVSIPEPLEYLDSSWKSAYYWYQQNMENYGWKSWNTSNYNIPNMWDTGYYFDIWSPGGSTFSTCVFCSSYEADDPIYDGPLIVSPWITRQESTRLTCGGGCNLDTSALGGGCKTSLFCKNGGPWEGYNIDFYGNASSIPSQPPPF